jgi:mannose-6-phosphate isomerase-like protein (cupin superfamily)
MKVRSTANAEHYVWGEVCDGWRLLDGPDLRVTLERIPAGRGEVDHYHRRARQLFFVLEGRLEVQSGRQRATLDAGASFEVPPGHVHRVWNPTVEDVRFLVISAPTTDGDRVTVGEPEAVGSVQPGSRA